MEVGDSMMHNTQLLWWTGWLKNHHMKNVCRSQTEWILRSSHIVTDKNDNSQVWYCSKFRSLLVVQNTVLAAFLRDPLKWLRNANWKVVIKILQRSNDCVNVSSEYFICEEPPHSSFILEIAIYTPHPRSDLLAKNRKKMLSKMTPMLHAFDL